MPHLIIQAAQFEVEEAKKKLKAAVEYVRSTCKHEKVWEVSYVPGHWLPYSPSRRMCMCCGLEEEENYGWSVDKDKVLRDSEERTVKVIDRNRFYSLRVD